MKKDEEIFFQTCWRLRHEGMSIREVIEAETISKLMPRERCWYLLRKWSNAGFYDYGVNIELGWFVPCMLPMRYAVLLTQGDVGRRWFHEQ